MKTILLPTDFSDTAENAIEYGAELAKNLNAKMILFHAYHVPVITSEVPVVLPTSDEIENDSMIALNEKKQKLLQKHPQLNIDCVCKYGLAADEIDIYEKENHIDLIVMGIHGAGYLSEKLIGSIPTSLIRKVKCPILIVGEESRFEPVKKIVFACDYEEMESRAVIEPLKEIAQAFGAHVYVVNVVREVAEIIPDTRQAIEGVKLEHSLEGLDHSFRFAENDDVVDGLNEFVDKEDVDMIAMIPHEHSMMNKMLHEPTTKQMAFHSHVPLLILNT